MEGSGVSSAGCAVHVVYMERRYAVGGCNFIATEHGRYGLVYGSKQC